MLLGDRVDPIRPRRSRAGMLTPHAGAARASRRSLPTMFSKICGVSRKKGGSGRRRPDPPDIPLERARIAAWRRRRARCRCRLRQRLEVVVEAACAGLVERELIDVEERLAGRAIERWHAGEDLIHLPGVEALDDRAVGWLEAHVVPVTARPGLVDRGLVDCHEAARPAYVLKVGDVDRSAAGDHEVVRGVAGYQGVVGWLEIQVVVEAA